MKGDSKCTTNGQFEGMDPKTYFPSFLGISNMVPPTM